MEMQKIESYTHDRFIQILLNNIGFLYALDEEGNIWQCRDVNCNKERLHGWVKIDGDRYDKVV